MNDPLVVEPTSTHDASIIWMHGLGASANDFADMPRFISRPGTRWIFPNAPMRKVTLNHGWRMPSWFDIRFLGAGAGESERECPVEAQESADYIASLIEEEHDRGIPYNRIVLIGFSQGGAMSLYLGCRFPERIAGMVCLSGYLIFHDIHMEACHEANRTTPVLVCHGTRDDMVPLSSSERTVEFLRNNGWPVEFEEYPMFHEVCIEEIRRVESFFSKILD